MTTNKNRDKKIQGIADEERYKEVKEMTTEEWNAKLEGKNKAKTGKMKDKKRRGKVQGKVIHGTTPEERFEEIHGITIEEWNAELEVKFKDKTGMTPDEWYVNQVKSTTPFEFINERYGTVTEDDIKLVKDLQLFGLKDGVINILLDYVAIFSSIVIVHPLVREMGENWHKENILTVEKAINFVREEHKKYTESTEK